MKNFYFMDPNGEYILPKENEKIHGHIAERVIKDSSELKRIFERVCSINPYYRTKLDELVFGKPLFLVLVGYAQCQTDMRSINVIYSSESIKNKRLARELEKLVAESEKFGENYQLFDWTQSVSGIDKKMLSDILAERNRLPGVGDDER